MSTFCQRLYHRKCQHREVVGPKKPKSCQRSLLTAPYLTFILLFSTDKPKQTTKVKDTPKKKEPIKKQPVQGNNKPVQGMLGLNKFDLKLHRLSETEISKWTTKSDFKKRTVSVNSRESSKSSKEIKGTKSKALIDDSSSSSDSDDASKSAPAKKSKEKTPVKEPIKASKYVEYYKAGVIQGLLYSGPWVIQGQSLATGRRIGLFRGARNTTG